MKMNVDAKISPRIETNDDDNEEKLPLYIDDEHDEKDNFKSNSKYFRTIRYRSVFYPVLLGLVSSIAVILLILVLTRGKSSIEEEKFTSNDSVECHRNGSSCFCPMSFVRSETNQNRCFQSSSRCAQLCLRNVHCSCHQLKDVVRCQKATRQWIEQELIVGPIEVRRSMFVKQTSIDTIEHFLIDHQKSSKKIFFSRDRRTAISLPIEDNYYLYNELWTKIDSNTTEQSLIYSQLDVETRSCLLSSIRNDGSVLHGQVHRCPGEHQSAPLFFASACENILVVWHGANRLNHKSNEDLATIHHNFESILPSAPILFDPFHRYYSLYEDSMIEIKDLNGNLLVQFFSDVVRPNFFRFVDFQGTFIVANQTHKQIFTTKNKLNWLDF